MKILLEIKDSKATFFFEVLKNFNFVKKVTPISDAKAELIEDIREAAIEMKEVKEGKRKAKDISELQWCI